MTTDLDEALRSAGADLRLDRPLTEVLDRGQRLRRRRYGARAAAVAAVVVVACAGTAAVLRPSADAPPDDASVAHEPVVRDEPLVTLTPDQLAADDATCRESTSSRLPAGLLPVVAHRRDGTSLLYYRFDERFRLCTVDRDPDGLVIGSGGTSGRWRPVPSGETYSSLSFGMEPVEVDPAAASGDLDLGALVAHASAAFVVTEDVARLVLHAGGEEFEATIAGEVAMVWLPDGQLSVGDTGDATVTTYGGDGEVLEEGTAHRYPQ